MARTGRAHGSCLALQLLELSEPVQTTASGSVTTCRKQCTKHMRPPVRTLKLLPLAPPRGEDKLPCVQTSREHRNALVVAHRSALTIIFHRETCDGVFRPVVVFQLIVVVAMESLARLPS